MNILKKIKKVTGVFLIVLIAVSSDFSTGTLLKAEDTINAEAVQEAVCEPVINYATEIGDSNASGNIDILDLIVMKKHIIGSAQADTVLSDIICDGYINALDLSALKRIFFGFEVELNYPRIVPTKYQTLSDIVADADVTQFGAVGDGKHDDTSAFINAMASLGSQGGTVWVPAGKYKLSQNITIPSNVILQGDFADPELYGADETKNGSVLEICVKPISQGNNTAFLSMQKYSSVKGFMMYYPEQTMENGIPVPYAYTIDIADWQSITLKDLYLVNPYKAIKNTSNPHNLETIQNVYMTPLYCGMEWQYNNDIGRFQNISIGPEWWLDSGVLPVAQPQTLEAWMKNNTSGIRIYGIDNAFVSDITVNGCKSAVYISGGYGKFYNIDINSCGTGVSTVGTTPYGFTFTNGSINADTVAVEMAAGSEMPLAFYNIDMSSRGEYIINNSSSSGISVTNGDLSLASDTGRYAVYNASGYSNIIGCGFSAENNRANGAYVAETSDYCRFVNFGTQDTLSYYDPAGNVKTVFDEVKESVFRPSLKTATAVKNHLTEKLFIMLRITVLTPQKPKIFRKFCRTL